MPVQKSIFLFAFANDREGSLRLGDEERTARNALTTPHISPSIEYINLGHASLDDIYRTFNRHHNRIALFHYGGHSDDQFLALTDTNARASSLSTLMGMQENLQLVFLNGCNNKGQVEALQYKGVKAIIATSVPIEDERALAFCQAFYEALSAGGEARKNIRQAFQTAKSRLENDPQPAGNTERGIRLKDQEKQSGFEWELYLLDDHPAEWSIPEPPQAPEDTDFHREVDLSHWKDQNKLLLELAFGIGEEEPAGLLRYVPDAAPLTQKFEADPDQVEHLDALRDQLFSALPSVVSIQLKDLFTFPEGVENGRLRLRELNEAYLTLARLLNAAALSSLWEAAFDPETLGHRAGFLIRDEYKKDIQTFLEPSDPVSAEHFDYIWLINTVNRIFQDPENQDFQPYVPELFSFSQSLETAPRYYEAYRFLEQQLRHRLIANDISSEEVESLCADAEGYLGLMLQQCAFLSTYELVTVKDVTVHQPRQQPAPVFFHDHFTLRGLDATDHANVYQSIDRSEAINNNSLYLARNFREESRPLNLSPFLIDENAFKSKLDVQLPKIHFFSGTKGSEALYYLHAEVPQTSVAIVKKQSERDAKFKRKASGNDKYVFEYYSQENGERKKLERLDVQNYKQKELQILFKQLELFRKALDI